MMYYDNTGRRRLGTISETRPDANYVVEWPARASRTELAGSEYDAKRTWFVHVIINASLARWVVSRTTARNRRTHLYCTMHTPCIHTRTNRTII